jgi:hypothetical protein
VENPIHSKGSKILARPPACREFSQATEWPKQSAAYPETAMLFVLTAVDKENALALRMDTRTAHLEYAKQTGVVRFGGPFLNDKGEMAGSMLVFEAADMDAARQWAANDPYAKAGLFAKSEIRAWKLTFNPNNITL